MRVWVSLSSYKSFIQLSNLMLSVLGVYYCYVANEIGESECQLEVTEEVLHGDVVDLIIIFIVSIIIAMIIFIVLAVLCYCCWKHRNRNYDQPGAYMRINYFLFIIISFQWTWRRIQVRVHCCWMIKTTRIQNFMKIFLSINYEILPNM